MLQSHIITYQSQGPTNFRVYYAGSTYFYLSTLLDVGLLVVFFIVCVSCMKWGFWVLVPPLMKTHSHVWAPQPQRPESSSGNSAVDLTLLRSSVSVRTAPTLDPRHSQAGFGKCDPRLPLATASCQVEFVTLCLCCVEIERRIHCEGVCMCVCVCVCGWVDSAPVGQD